jgi:hypothetical protein
VTIEHEINVDRTDQGHWAYCACGYRGQRRQEVEHAFFDANDHRVRHLCRRLRRRAGWKLLPAGLQMWPWLFAHQRDLGPVFGGELAAIVARVENYLAEYVPTGPPARTHKVLVAA